MKKIIQISTTEDFVNDLCFVTDKNTGSKAFMEAAFKLPVMAETIDDLECDVRLLREEVARYKNLIKGISSNYHQMQELLSQGDIFNEN